MVFGGMTVEGAGLGGGVTVGRYGRGATVVGGQYSGDDCRL